MDDAARVRSNAIRSVRDVTPEPLRGRIENRIEEAPLTPALVTVASARHHDRDETDARAFESAAAVQQIYVGLDITRELIELQPWDGVDEHPHEADMEIIAADVLVAQGMARLAATDAAMAAVEVVREFGQFEAEQIATTQTTDARCLEETILELAVLAGSAAVDTVTSESILTWVRSLSPTQVAPLPTVTILLESTPLEPSIEVSPRAQAAKDGLRSGAGDTD